MKRFRRQRLRTTLSLLAIVALLWSQMLLASHPACTLASMAMDSTHAAQADHAGSKAAPCHSSSMADSSPVCDSHCSRGDLSPDVSRVLAVPALGLLPAIPVVCVQHLPQSPDAAQTPGPLGSWHRPTPHPASLLLI
jgi:hypothetical protein